MIKLAGYLLLGFSIYRFYHDQEAITYGFILLAAFLCGGIKLNLDGLGVLLILVGIYFCIQENYPLGISLIVVGILLSKTSNKHGDWTDFFWDIDLGSFDGGSDGGSGDGGGGDGGGGD